MGRTYGVSLGKGEVCPEDDEVAEELAEMTEDAVGKDDGNRT